KRLAAQWRPFFRSWYSVHGLAGRFVGMGGHSTRARKRAATAQPVFLHLNNRLCWMMHFRIRDAIVPVLLIVVTALSWLLNGRYLDNAIKASQERSKQAAAPRGQ